MLSNNTPPKNRKTILICPLDWGLGHIARDLPLIKTFRQNGHRVIVAASPRLIQWLKTEYADVETTLFPGPDIRYGQNGLLILKLALQLPELIWWYFREKKHSATLVARYQPDLIISDNRYGVRYKSVFSVIITHQLMLKLPRCIKWMEYPLHLVINKLIQGFNECWVPDFEKEFSLAGDLVHKYQYPANIKLIGPLSRFDGSDLPQKNDVPPDPGTILAIISGPEPHRSRLENKLEKTFDNTRRKTIILRGKDFHKEFLKAKSSNREVYNHLPTDELLLKIMACETIIARSGYSTIMDMYILNRPLLMIPTPGQTEQQYLAKYHHKKEQIRPEANDLKDLFPSIFIPPSKQIRIYLQEKNFRKVLRNYFE